MKKERRMREKSKKSDEKKSKKSDEKKSKKNDEGNGEEDGWLRGGFFGGTNVVLGEVQLGRVLAIASIQLHTFPRI